MQGNGVACENTWVKIFVFPLLITCTESLKLSERYGA